MTAVQTDYNNIAAFYEDKWTSFLHPAREWTLERITNTAFSKPINIIDLGCGTGAFLQSLRHCQPDALLTGIDTSSAMLVQAQMRFKGDKDTTLEQSDIENFNMDDEIYDVVSCHYVLHHIKRQKEFISKILNQIDSNNTDWINYEEIQSDIFDHLLAALNQFDLKIYQRPSGNDLSKLISNT